MTIEILVILIIAIWGYFAYFSLRKKSDFKRSLNMTFLRILIPKKDSEMDEKKETVRDFKEQISLMEQLLSSLKTIYSGSFKSKFFGQDYISLEYLAANREINFYLVVPKKAQNLVEKQITGFYPDAIIDEVQEYNIFKNRKVVKAISLSLKKDFFLPIKTYQKLESDPINNITNAFSKLSQFEACSVQILLKPSSDDWQNKTEKALKQLKKWFKGFSLNPLIWIISFLSLIFSDPKEKKWEDKDDKDNDKETLMKEKKKKVGYEVIIRVISAGDDELLAEAQLKNIIWAFSQFSSPGFNSFKKDKISSDLVVRNYIFRYFKSSPLAKKNILNIEEIASLYHFPHSKYNKTPEIKWQNFKIVKAPANIPDEWLLLWENYYRGIRTEIRLKNEDRFRHFYVIGQTWTGKSSILQVMARQDLQNGKWIAVVDPHGDLAEDLLPFVPRNRADDVIYFNPADTARPLWINLLEANSEDEKQAVAQDSMNIMLKLFWNEIFWPRIQDYFRNWVLTLMDYPGGWALTDLVRLFTDDDFQKERTRTLKNPIVKSWWNYTFAKMWEREKWEMIPFWAAKFGWFITNTMMRNIIGQVKSSFDVYDIMQNNKILFVNLSKWVLGDINSTLLWLVIVSKIQIAAMRRQLIAKEERNDFFLYIDEFQNYITDSIESILSEARKYRLGLIVAHQYLGQLQKSDALTKSNTNLKDAIFWNVWSLMSYKIWPEDAEFMAKQFSPNFSNQDLMNIDKFKATMKLSIDWQPSPAFSVTPVNPYLDKWDPKLAKAFKELSRLKYWRDREFIEKEIIFRIWAM
ncbi:MAG: hypothetical protein ACD_49C00021G0022 [uncultured bacterium (gcode 4)]|uniref:Uncharacterized protein n=1 Tax=uncultured bacterium (gcode 4) TaxID=1234023 RepID=K2AYA8_9BACT|nr:MAG: hypothetical protein ACD_49C00021G0022 [uncultured bacterium (gcode 4)]